MARVKNTKVTLKRRKKVIKQAKGYFNTKSTSFKKAKEQVMKSLSYAYRDRKNVKREYRRLWITRINAAARLHGLSYSTFMNGLIKSGIEINRKMLSELAINNKTEFELLIAKSKEALKLQDNNQVTNKI